MTKSESFTKLAYALIITGVISFLLAWYFLSFFFDGNYIVSPFSLFHLATYPYLVMGFFISFFVYSSNARLKETTKTVKFLFFNFLIVNIYWTAKCFSIESYALGGVVDNKIWIPGSGELPVYYINDLKIGSSLLLLCSICFFLLSIIYKYTATINQSDNS